MQPRFVFFFWSAVFYRSLIQPTAVTLGSKGIEAVAQILVGDGLRGFSRWNPVEEDKPDKPDIDTSHKQQHEQQQEKKNTKKMMIRVSHMLTLHEFAICTLACKPITCEFWSLKEVLYSIERSVKEQQ